MVVQENNPFDDLLGTLSVEVCDIVSTGENVIIYHNDLLILNFYHPPRDHLWEIVMISEQNVINFFSFDNINIKVESPNPGGWAEELKGGSRRRGRGRAKRHW